jgi:diguanylate cyclase (GGDEF)-like protein
MILSGRRTRWLIALVVAIVALPILGITAYLTYGVQQQIAHTQGERVGLAQIVALDRFFSDASQFALATACPQLGLNARELRARADTSFTAVDILQAAAVPAPPSWSDVRDAWQALRRPSSSTPRFGALFDSMDAAFMSVGDRSGLTFDSDFAGISLGDSLSYRLPEARLQLQAARRRLCSFSNVPTLAERLDLKRHQVLADKSIADGLQDESDAIHMAGKRFDSSALALTYAAALRAAPRASSELESFMNAAHPANHAATQRALDAATASLAAVMRAETPALDQMFSLRLADYGRQRLIRLVPGLVGVLAALLVALLMVRLVLEHAALQVANATAAEQESMALHDGLTGIMNRRAFFSALERAVTGGTNHGALCVFDVDHFKAVNDTYGHPVGDELLVRLAQTIEAAVRSTDAVARLGGDEFAVFLHPPIDRRGVERFLEKITADVAQPVEIRGQTIRGSVSVGAALIRGETMSEVQDALARADVALYQAKATARGGFVVSDDTE